MHVRFAGPYFFLSVTVLFNLTRSSLTTKVLHLSVHYVLRLLILAIAAMYPNPFGGYPPGAFPPGPTPPGLYPGGQPPFPGAPGPFPPGPGFMGKLTVSNY